MGLGPGSARSVETPLLVLKALDLARASGVSHANANRRRRLWVIRVILMVRP
jgi:hypothetical protein